MSPKPDLTSSTADPAPHYTVRRAQTPPTGQGHWDDPAWTPADPLEITHFQARSSAHRPRTRARLLYDDTRLFVIFHVADHYVRAVAREYQDMVCWDSCVEFFVQPRGTGGYFNFEVSANGHLLLYYIREGINPDGQLNNREPVPPEAVRDLTIHHSLPDRIEPERVGPCEWTIEYAIPLALFARYTGPVTPLTGQTWRANFYKCGDRTSQPHWGMWAPVQTGNSFHQPRFFGWLRFA
ncbi:MAG: carbohydrate-binding family 9-like protein [Candidatus Marinimicrobia bacterium]|nr:carbohydrate-binding family 9-like protein [Candidatus Neomarinimicrobiota bacterium]